MKTLLLDHRGDVYKVVGEYPTAVNGITYICEYGEWCPVKDTYLFDQVFVEEDFIHESDSVVIDTNVFSILSAKLSMMGFDNDY